VTPEAPLGGRRLLETPLTRAQRRRSVPCLILVFTLGVAACATTGPSAGGSKAGKAVLPGRTVRQTLERAIALLENYQCADFAVNFLNPIKRAQIEDLDAYRLKRQCSREDRGNLEDVKLALRMAVGAVPTIDGVKAKIDLSGIGLQVPRFEFVKYIDGLWYFNEL
jgi:hypothetical protein